MIDVGKAKIGTSGYSFLDWIGVFYPEGIQKSKMLDHYVTGFNTVEVNSSFYRIPHPKIFENMEKKTPRNFDFIVKAYKGFTHDRSDIKKSAGEFHRSVEPLLVSGKLRGVLLQFPYSFKRESKNVTYLMSVIDLLQGFPIYIEFRHRGWLRDEVFELLERTGVSVCSIDGPQISALPKHELYNVSKRIYVRLHGRNAEQWWNGGALRYDYLYSRDQLDEWIRKIRECETPAESIYIFFNNCHRGQAIQNAKMMAELLKQESTDGEAEQ